VFCKSKDKNSRAENEYRIDILLNYKNRYRPITVWEPLCTVRGFVHAVSVSLFTVWRVFLYSESVTVSNFHTSAYMHTIHTFHYSKSF